MLGRIHPKPLALNSVSDAVPACKIAHPAFGDNLVVESGRRRCGVCEDLKPRGSDFIREAKGGTKAPREFLLRARPGA